MSENIREILHWILTLLALAFTLFVMIRLLAKWIATRRAPVKTVKAQVVDKQTREVFSKYNGSGKRKEYIVTFSAEGERLSFYVSEFSYDGYRINEWGTLTYQGGRLVDFR